MDKEKIEYMKTYYQKNKYNLQKFNLFGIRDEKGMKDDIINDHLGFFTDNEIFIVPGTTDPSVYWTINKERNKAGTFHLVEGFHNQIWTFGIHKGYKAFVNDYKYCKPTKGWRDANYNFTLDKKDIVVCDYFGVNFHRMNESMIMRTIGKYSAGCQVVQKKEDFDYILEKAKSSGITIFNYMLFKKEELPENII